MQLDPHHPPLKLIRRLRDKKHSLERGLCLVEGWKCYHEAHSQQTMECTLLTSSCQEHFDKNYPSCTHPLYTIDDHELKKLCGSTSPEGIVGVCTRPAVSPTFPNGTPGSLHLVLYEWRDPGNVGAVIRSARGLGAASVTLWSSGPDFFSSKVIRASMGSVFHFPLGHVSRDTPLPPQWQILLALAQGTDSRSVSLSPDEPTLLLIGSESHGLPSGVDQTGVHISIPLKEELESLSAPIAASLLIDRLINGNCSFTQ